jgi:CubicO group peptidase (beta-lactamase class C family)
MPPDEFFEQRIFAPLGMRATTFWPAENQGRASRRSTNAKSNVGSAGCRTTRWGATSTSVAPAASQHGRKLRAFGMMLSPGGEPTGVAPPASPSKCSRRHVPDTLPGRPPGEGYGLSVRVTDHAARHALVQREHGWSGA